MLFRRLLERNARAVWLITAEGYVVSIVTHVILLGATVVATTDPLGQREIADSFTPVEYFIPKDRTIGVKRVQERLSYMSVAAPGGGGQAPSPPMDSKLLEVKREVGEADDEQAGQSAPPVEPEIPPGDTVMTVLDVDTAAVRYEDSAAPPYPPSMLEKRIEGMVAIQYVVDTTGHADTSSVVILSATHNDFVTSVKHTLPVMRFRPAVMNAHKVRQLVQQLFSFKIDTTMFAQQQQRQQQGKKP
jgi:hypothetical protein